MELEHAFTYGTHPIYRTLYTQLVEQDNQYDQVLINLATITRNVCSDFYKDEEIKLDKGTSTASNVIKRLTNAVRKETQDFIIEIALMLHERPSSVEKIILTYWYDYSDLVPQQYLKKERIPFVSDIIGKVRANYTRGKLATYNYHGIKIFDTYLNQDNVIDTLGKMVHSFSNQRNVLHVSHHPIDYHLAPYCNSWATVKSYTGELIPADKLGYSVFKLREVPFTRQIHVLLGDRTDLKPLLDPDKKSLLISAMQQESWYVRTEEDIQERLQKLAILTPYHL